MIYLKILFLRALKLISKMLDGTFTLQIVKQQKILCVLNTLGLHCPLFAILVC